MTTLRRTAANSFFYGLSSILQRASSIIFFPIFSIFLTKKDYGTIGTIQNISTFLTLFVGLQIARSITRFVYDKIDDSSYQSTLIGTTFYAVLITNLIVIPLIFLSHHLLSRFVLNEIPFYPFLVVGALTIPFASIFELYKTYLIATHQGKKVFIINMSLWSCVISLNLIFVIIFKMGALGVLLGSLIGTTFLCAYSFLVHFKKSLTKINLEILKDVLAYSLPLIPFALFGILLSTFSALYLNAKINVAIAGIFYIATMVSLIMSTMKESVIQAFTPWFFLKVSTEDQKYIRKTFDMVYVAVGIISLGITWFTFEALSILSQNPRLVVAWKYTPILIFGLYIVFLGQLLNLPTYHEKKNTKYLSLSTFTGCLIIVPLNWLLVEKYQAYGSSIAQLLSFVGMVIVQAFISTRLSNYKLNYSFLLTTTLIALPLFGLPYLPVSYPLLLTLKVVILSGIIIPFVVYLQKKYGFLKMLKDKAQSLILKAFCVKK